VLLRRAKQVVIDAFLLAGEHMWTSLENVDLSGEVNCMYLGADAFED